MAKKKSTFFADFKAFISKGNILDMAVGVVVGGAFGKIVSSLVADIITPLITLLTGGVSFAEKYVALVTPDALAGEPLPETATLAKEAGYSILTYGNFIQTIIDFLLVALSIFLVLRVITKSKALAEKKKIAAAEAKAAEEKAAADAKAAEEAAAAAALAERQAKLEEATLEQAKLLAEIKNLIASK